MKSSFACEMMVSVGRCVRLINLLKYRRIVIVVSMEIEVCVSICLNKRDFKILLRGVHG